MKKICPYCKKEIDMTYSKYVYGGHIGSCSKNPNRIRGLEKLRITNLKLKKEYVFKCKKCNIEYRLLLNDNTYKKENYRTHCSRKCANSHIQTEKQNKRRSEIILRKIKSGEIISHPGLKGKLSPTYKETGCERVNKENKFKTFDKFKGICQKCSKNLIRKETTKWVAHHNNKHNNREKYNDDKDRILWCLSCHISYHNSVIIKKDKNYDKYILF